MPKKPKIYDFPPPILKTQLLSEWNRLSPDCRAPESALFVPSSFDSLISWVAEGNENGLPVLEQALRCFDEVIPHFDRELGRMMVSFSCVDKKEAYKKALFSNFKPSLSGKEIEAKKRLLVFSHASKGDFVKALNGLVVYPECDSWEKDALYEKADDDRCACLPSPLKSVSYSRELVDMLKEPHLEALLEKDSDDPESKLSILAKNYRRVMNDPLSDDTSIWVALSMIEIGVHVLKGKRSTSAIKAALWFRLAEALGHAQAGVYLSDALSKMSTGDAFWATVQDSGFSKMDASVLRVIENSLSNSAESLPDEETWGRTKSQAYARLAVIWASRSGSESLRLFDLSRCAKFKEAPPDVKNAEAFLQKITPVGTVKILNDFPNGPDRELPKYERLKLPVRLVGSSGLEKTGKILDNEFPWMKQVTEHVMSSLHLLKYTGNSFAHFHPILLVGSPGIGKTRYCSRLAEICGLPFRVMPTSRTMDNHIMSGMSRGWKDAQPSLLSQWILTELVGNPLLVLDELDKAAEKQQIGDALYLLLEPSTARKYPDNFLGVPCDFGWVNWMATANSLLHVPSVLKSRFAIFEVSDPLPEHYPLLLKRAKSDLAHRLRVPETSLPHLSDDELNMLRPFFTSPRAAISAMYDLMGRLASTRNKMH